MCYDMVPCVFAVILAFMSCWCMCVVQVHRRLVPTAKAVKCVSCVDLCGSLQIVCQSIVVHSRYVCMHHKLITYNIFHGLVKMISISGLGPY